MGDPVATREPGSISGAASLAQPTLPGFAAPRGGIRGHSGREVRTFCASTSAPGPDFTSTVAAAMT